MDNIASVIIAVGTLIAAIGGFIKIWYDVKQVHVIVNSQRTAMMEKIDSLRELLDKSQSREAEASEAKTQKTKGR